MNIADAILSAQFDPAEKPFFAKVHEHFRRVVGGRRSEPVDSYLDRLIGGAPLSEPDARALFAEILKGELAEDQIGSLLVALQPDMLSASTLAAFADVLRKHGLTVNPPPGESLVDTCGTGSDTMSTFNVSTTIMPILAAAGMKIAKHGNRAVTSQCGSADVLEALGVRVDLEPEGVETCLRDVGIGFMYAPVFHRALRNLSKIRGMLAREMPDNIKGRTVFNVLGPLANPANVQSQIVGVYSPTLLTKFAEALRLLKVRRAFVAYGLCDGLSVGFDEFSTAGPTQVAELHDGVIRMWEVTPEEVGLPRTVDPAAFSGGDKTRNAAIFLDLLAGREEGARMDLTLMNAGAGLFLGDKAASIAEGVGLARELIRSGEALAKFEAFRARTRSIEQQ